VGWEGLYEISDQGRVKSLDRVVMRSNGNPQRWKERILKPGPSTYGHLFVSLHKNGAGRSRSVHSLVAEAFIGPRPDGLQVCHGEGGKLDNSLANLRYATPVENHADRLRDGTHNRGEGSYQAKLTAEQVKEARRLVATGPKGTQARLAKEWGVGRPALNQAVKGISWSWLT
jgi:hypothetical protein